MQKQLPMHLSQRCLVYARRTKKPCQSPAMANGRCRLHGGKATGAPMGNQNATKTGNYSAKEVVNRMESHVLLRQIREYLKTLSL